MYSRKDWNKASNSVERRIFKQNETKFKSLEDLVEDAERKEVVGIFTWEIFIRIPLWYFRALYPSRSNFNITALLKICVTITTVVFV